MATRELRALTVDEVLALLKKPAPTVICCHARPDADCLGSGLALALWLKAMGSDAYCVCADEIPQYLRFLTKDLQESVLPESLPGEFENARVVSVDTSSPSQMDRLFEMFGDRVSVMIDHHEKGEPYADHFIEHTAACAELVWRLITASGVPMSRQMATLLYAGLSSDTGCFRYSNVKGSTHLTAAALVETGIDAADINRQLHEVRQYESLKAEKAGFERLSFYEGGRIAILTFPYALQAELGVRDEHLGTLIDVARCVSGVVLSAAIRGTRDGRFRVSLRASADIDVAAVAARFGGGGHVRAAGVTLDAGCMDEAREMILSALKAALDG